MNKNAFLISVTLFVSVGLAIGWVKEVSATVQNVPFITVGSSTGCDYHNLTDAINAAASGDEIHVEAKTFTENPIIISNKDLKIIGGYASSGTCLAETPNGNTTLQRSGSTPGNILMINSSNNFWLENFVVSNNQNGGGLYVDHSNVTLKNVEIENNTYSGVFASMTNLSMMDVGVSNNQASGVSMQYGAITLTHVSISNNNGGVGGGMSLIGSSSLPLIVRMNSVDIFNNSAVNGGGVYASDHVSMTLSQTYIYYNQVTGASGFGGGIMASSYVTITLKDGVDINFNQAPNSGFGGGIALLNGAKLNATGATFGSNIAGMSGGAIYASDNSQINVDQVEFASNTADSGGGIDLMQSDMNCTRSFFHDNQALTGGGGAVLVEDGVIDVDRTKFVYNHAKNEGGALKITGNTSTAVFTSTNSLYAENADLVSMQVSPNAIEAAGGSSTVFEKANAYFAHNTMLRYNSAGATFGVVAKDDAVVEMMNNIIGNFYVGAIRSSGTNGVVSMDHTLFFGNSQNYDSNFTSTNEINGDPAFLGPYDFHLTGSSDAIGQAVDLGLLYDLDGKPRILGVKPDLGAYEYGGVLYLPILNR